MNNLTFQLILILMLGYSFVTTYLKYDYYRKGYGWSFTRIQAFNPMYGLVAPKKVTKSERNFLFFEIGFNFLLNVLFLVFWLSGGMDNLFT